MTVTVEWMGRALCAQIGGDMWFPEKGGSSIAAIAVCNVCPVAQECLAFSETLPPGERQHGIWGGKSPMARKLPTSIKTCTMCSEQFTPATKQQKICSAECRTEARKQTYAKQHKRSVA